MESSILSGLSASLVGSNIQKHKVAEGSSILGSLSPRQTFKKNDENFGHCDQCSCKMSCFRNNKTLKLCFSHGLSAGSLTFWCFLWSTNHLMSNLRSHQEAYNQRQTCDPTWLPRRWWRRGRTLPSCCRQTGEQTLLLCGTIGKLKSLDYTKSIKEIWRHKWQLLFRFFLHNDIPLFACETHLTSSPHLWSGLAPPPPRWRELDYILLQKCCPHV